MSTSITMPLDTGAGACPKPVIIAGAGMAGLAAALRLAAHGVAVIVIEKEPEVGGKIRQSQTSCGPVDVGPTVFTMRRVFDGLFAEAGESLDSCMTIETLECLAHHRWTDGSRLNLYADTQQSRDAIGRFAGLEEARGFDRFLDDTRQLHDALLDSFMQVDQPGLLGLIRGLGTSGLSALGRASPFRSLHQQLQRYFRDPRLLQLFGRYATYCGSSPYAAPASLALIAHVEQAGVWTIKGGITQLALALRQAAERRGAQFVLGETVGSVDTASGVARGVRLASGDFLECSALILNADVNALREGLFGAGLATELGLRPRPQRSLSAVTWSGTMASPDTELRHHNVCFSSDYAAEFRQLFGQLRPPTQPTVYLCAPDRTGSVASPGSLERIFALVNAPAIGDTADPQLLAGQLETTAAATAEQLSRCGIQLSLDPADFTITGPAEFHRRYPATGGALYGAATHGWRAAFQRPGNRTRVRNLYLAGGSVHPGPGVPMAALSGMSAAAWILAGLGINAKSPIAGTVHA